MHMHRRCLAKQSSVAGKKLLKIEVLSLCFQTLYVDIFKTFYCDFFYGIIFKIIFIEKKGVFKR